MTVTRTSSTSAAISPAQICLVLKDTASLSPDEITSLSAKLAHLQEKDEQGWNTAIKLLKSPSEDEVVHVFAAKILSHRALHNVQSLPPLARAIDQIRNVLDLNPATSVVNQLALTLAALSLRLIDENPSRVLDFVSDLGDLTPHLTSNVLLEMAQLAANRRKAPMDMDVASIFARHLLPGFPMIHNELRSILGPALSVSIGVEWAAVEVELSSIAPHTLDILLSDNEGVQALVAEFPAAAENLFSISCRVPLSLDQKKVLFQVLRYIATLVERQWPPALPLFFQCLEVASKCIILDFLDLPEERSSTTWLLQQGLQFASRERELDSAEAMLRVISALLDPVVQLVHQVKTEPAKAAALNQGRKTLSPVIEPMILHIYAHFYRYGFYAENLDKWLQFRDNAAVSFSDVASALTSSRLIKIAAEEMGAEEWSSVEGAFSLLAIAAPKTPAGQDEIIPKALYLIPSLKVPPVMN